jgi:hypothetical protein
VFTVCDSLQSMTCDVFIAMLYKCYMITYIYYNAYVYAVAEHAEDTRTRVIVHDADRASNVRNTRLHDLHDAVQGAERSRPRQHSHDKLEALGVLNRDEIVTGFLERIGQQLLGIFAVALGLDLQRRRRRALGILSSSVAPNSASESSKSSSARDST